MKNYLLKGGKMKIYILFNMIFFLLISSLIHCQSIGVSGGYGFTNMKKVNREMEYSPMLYYFIGEITPFPEDVTGGLLLEGNFKYGIEDYNLGVLVEYISSSGGFSFNNTLGSINKNYDVSTIEILGLFEFLIQIEDSPIQPFVQLAGGVGIASAEHTGEFRFYEDPTINYSVKNTVSGNYFASRMKFGLQFVLQNIILETAVGYRIAKAGELKGELVENGTSFNDMPILGHWTTVELSDWGYEVVEFNYSGFILTGGISILL